MAAKSALDTIDDWTNRAFLNVDQRRVSLVVIAALDVMKCLVEKDLQRLGAATEVLIKKYNFSFEQKGNKKRGLRYLIHGLSESLIATARAVTESKRIEFGGLQDANTNICAPGVSNAEIDAIRQSNMEPLLDSDRVIKEEEETFDDSDEDAGAPDVSAGGIEAVDPEPLLDPERAIKEEEDMIDASDGYPPQVSTPPEDAVKLEEYLKEEPLCPPLVDTIVIQPANVAAPSTSKHDSARPSWNRLPLPPPSNGLRFRKATKRDYEHASMTPLATPTQTPATFRTKPPSEPVAYLSPLNAAFAKPIVIMEENPHKKLKNTPHSPSRNNYEDETMDLEAIGSVRASNVRNMLMTTCEDCNRAFHDPEKYAAHCKKAHPVYSFPCGKCGWKFGRKCDLQRHETTHEEGKHACRFCERSFTSMQTRDTHVKREHGERPYACGACDAAFAGAETLKQHQSRIHSETHDE
ncbi:hypothetical protein PFISCL1PPCAC_22536 [Pristionchus fissidentatus]|uniref:C2H2-type domain-containing protein n=1 Tax=Pristionchus fissidentatus TaxID=1538716 RepID=A0AAV5WNB3_9BILA|nr:hypothetical protein PFISCL1PPCAC_22536 [Pristionchus fissidentatus]